jgi:hypothetical protein
MAPATGNDPLRHPQWYWLLSLALFLVAGLLGATWLADVAGFPPPYSGLNILLRVLCGFAVALLTLIVVQFHDHASPT